MTVYWDIDGVIRNLSVEALGREASHWEDKENGKTVVDLVNEDLDILLRAKPLPYLGLANSFLKGIQFLSYQPKTWRPNTLEWLREYMQVPFSVRFAQEKLALLKPGDWLIDDFPFFRSFQQVILVKQPYNKGAEARIRVDSPLKLEAFLSPCCEKRKKMEASMGYSELKNVKFYGMDSGRP